MSATDRDWKELRRKPRRGQHCLVLYGGTKLGSCLLAPSYAEGGCLCGCGSRVPPSKRRQRRGVRRLLARKLKDERD